VAPGPRTDVSIRTIIVNMYLSALEVTGRMDTVISVTTGTAATLITGMAIIRLPVKYKAARITTILIIITTETMARDMHQLRQ
jgi:hypothetical protein